MAPFVTCEMCFGQNVCELVLGVDIPDLNFWIQVYSVKQPVQSNFVGPGNMSQSGTSTLMIILITASLSSKMYNIAPL